MRKFTAAVKLVLADLAQLNKPAVASAIAAVAVPLLAAVAGLQVTAAEVGGWLLIAGAASATLQKLEAVAEPDKPPAVPKTSP